MKPNPKKKPLPAVPQMAEPIDDKTQRIMREAEEEREQAWSEEPAWLGEALHPWSMARESLLLRLIDADVPAADLEQIPLIEGRLKKSGAALALEQVVEVGLYLPTAAKVLYLASHPPAAWDHLRGRDASRFLRAVEDWAEAGGIPPGEEWPAVRLAHSIRTAHERMRVLRRPGRSTGRDSGN